MTTRELIIQSLSCTLGAIIWLVYCWRSSTKSERRFENMAPIYLMMCSAPFLPVLGLVLTHDAASCRLCKERDKDHAVWFRPPEGRGS